MKIIIQWVIIKTFQQWEVSNCYYIFYCYITTCAGFNKWDYAKIDPTTVSKLLLFFAFTQSLEKYTSLLFPTERPSSQQTKLFQSSLTSSSGSLFNEVMSTLHWNWGNPFQRLSFGLTTHSLIIFCTFLRRHQASK